MAMAEDGDDGPDCGRGQYNHMQPGHHFTGVAHAAALRSHPCR